MSPLNVFAIDYSGSTSGVTNYWSEVSRIISPTTDENTRYIFWDNRKPMVINKEEVQKKVENRSKFNGGGTDPSTIITEIAELTSNVCLTLITDGQVGSDAIGRCDDLMEKHKIKFEQVSVHFINTGGSMNLSVAAPFIRETKYQIMVGGNLTEEGTTHCIDLEQYRDQPVKFIREAPDIIKQLEMQNLGRYNHQMRNKLLDLQKDLLKKISADNASGNFDKFASLRSALSLNNYDLAMSLMKDITSALDHKMGKGVEAIFQTMLQKCDGRSNLSFDILKSNRLTRAPEMKNVTPDNLEEAPSKEYLKFECPITCDYDAPVLLIKNGSPILEGLDKSYQDYLISNPLAMLDNLALVDALKNRLDQSVGFKTAQTLFSGKEKIKSPFSREEIECFVSMVDESSHNEATNFALANLFFGTKLVGVPELWLSVVYLVAKKMDRLSLDTHEDNSTTSSTLIESFKEMVISRMRNNDTNITLTGLPIKPSIKCPVDMALWYCVISPWIYNDIESNRLRSIGTKHHLELLDMFNYPYKKEWTAHQLDLYKVFKSMMSQAKGDDAHFRKSLRSKYQNSITLKDGSIILLDGSPLETSELFEFSVSIPEALSLSRLVNWKDKVGATIIPNNLDTLPIPEAKTNYGYPDDKSIFQMREISPITMRPFVYDPHTKKHWEDSAKEKLGCPVESQLSAYGYFIKFVDEKDKFPGREEFINYMADKQANRENSKMDTLPKEIKLIVDNVFSSYIKVGVNLDSTEQSSNTISVEEFRKRANASRSRETRLKLDGSEPN